MINTLVVNVTLAELDECYNVCMEESNSALDVELDTAVNVTGGTYYTGDYEVIPQASNEIILPTEGLVMSDDVTVRKIPYYETSNESGKTAYIASEV